ncbi:MAG TPA: hypothetical protein VGE27_14715 [Gemmatimonas sp.]|uniref:hypothetical protein n=1 Tax=Gemmatimonas sp. TaxID=1962908 RepID=UPI002EDA7AAD
MIDTPGTTRHLREQAARMVAIVIILLGIIDPVFTITRSVPPVVAVWSADSSRYAPELSRVHAALAPHAAVIFGPAPEADAQVTVGAALPTNVTAMTADTSVAFVVNVGTTRGVHVERWRAPNVATLDGRIVLETGLARDAATIAPANAADSVRVRVEVRDDSVLVVERSVSLTAGARASVSLPYVPIREGTQVLDMRLVEGADTVHWQHALHIQSKPWHVLVYDPRPSWLSTFVRRTVERDARFRVSSRVVTSRQVSRATTLAPGSLAAVERQTPLPDVLVVGAPDALNAADVNALDRLLTVHGVAVVLLPDHLAPGGSLAAARTGLDALVQAREWRLLPPLPSNAPRVVRQAGAPGTAMDSVHLLATSVATPLVMPHDAEAVATTSAGASVGTQSTVAWRVPHGRGTLLVHGAFDAWRFRDAARSTFDATWRDLIADMAARRTPLLAISAAPADEAWPRSVLLRTNASGASGNERPLVRLTHAGDTVSVRLLPTNVAGTWRVTWPAFTRANPPVALLRATWQGDTVFSPVLVDNGQQLPDSRTTEQLAAWAKSRGGRMLSGQGIDSLPALITQAIGDRRRPSPWHPMRIGWWIVPLALAFGTEWWLRRRRGSP